MVVTSNLFNPSIPAPWISESKITCIERQQSALAVGVYLAFSILFPTTSSYVRLWYQWWVRTADKNVYGSVGHRTRQTCKVRLGVVVHTLSNPKPWSQTYVTSAEIDQNLLRFHEHGKRFLVWLFRAPQFFERRFPLPKVDLRDFKTAHGMNIVD